MVGQFGSDPADPYDLFLFAFLWSSKHLRFDRTNRGKASVMNLYNPFRAERTRLNCVPRYTNAAFDSNLKSTPAVGSRNSNGDICPNTCRIARGGGSRFFSGSRRHHRSLPNFPSRGGHSEIVGEPTVLVVIVKPLAIDWRAGRLPPRFRLPGATASTVVEVWA